MGNLIFKNIPGEKAKAIYIQQLLTDIEALEQMLEKGMLEKAPVRIGAEQEFCLVDELWEPSNKAMEVLRALDDPKITTELARYNLEINLDPVVLSGECFTKMHGQLDGLLEKVRKESGKWGLKVILTGILPTIDKRHLTTSYMTPIERYQVLDQTIRKFRGSDIELHIKGVDEINLHHDSILLEGCNTSFQAHLQIDPDHFADTYNWCQVISGPVLSITANSPILMGRELWQETRIALFTQSVDTRASGHILHEREARVGFGNDWAKGSVASYYREEIVRFRSLLHGDFETDSLSELNMGKVPKLKALGLHNGTVYKWNRVCYGVTHGKPHIRIENRYMPAGPTTTDEIANLMFWVGLMMGRPKSFDTIQTKMDFKDVKSNFYNAARYGTAAQFYWDGRLVPCKDLLLDHLLPMAYRGLYAMHVKPEDAERYLSVIENRIKTHNGARWSTQSLRKLKKNHKSAKALQLLTADMYFHERKGYTVDAWELSRETHVDEGTDTRTVRQVMSTEIITAQEDDSAELVLKMMQWKDIHHVPIVNYRLELVGLLTWTDMLHYLDKPKKMSGLVKSIMKTNVITITAEATLSTARELMKSNQINCLPVLDHKELLAIITSKDL